MRTGRSLDARAGPRHSFRRVDLSAARSETEEDIEAKPGAKPDRSAQGRVWTSPDLMAITRETAFSPAKPEKRGAPSLLAEAQAAEA